MGNTKPATETWRNPSAIVTRPVAGLSIVILVVLVIALGVLNYFWLSRNTVPPHWDAANHMRSALKYHAVLSQCFDLSSLSFSGARHCVGELVFVDTAVYAPLVAFTGGVASFLTGTSVTALAMLNVPFLALLLGCVYLCGRACHSRLAGLLAALLVVAYPLVLQSSREFMLEVPMLAMTAAAAYCLIASDTFKNAAATACFGVVLGLGALTKFTLITYLAGPGVYVVICLAIDAARHRVDAREVVRRLTSVSTALALGVLIAAVWYWPQKSNFLSSLAAVTSLDTTGKSLFAPGSLTYYANAMPWDQMGLPLFLLFLYGLIRFGSQVRADHRGFLIAWMASIYLIHTFGTFKAPPNDIGILLPAALISAIGIASLERARRPAVALVVCFSALQIAVFTLPARTLAARIGTFGWRGESGSIASPRTEDWKIESVLRSVATRPVRVAVVSDHVFVNGTTVDFYRMKDHLPAEVTACWQLGRAGTDPSDFSTFDVVIAKSDAGWAKPAADGCFRGPEGPAQYEAVIRRLEDGSAGFNLIESVPLPDGSSLLVFSARRPDRPV